MADRMAGRLLEKQIDSLMAEGLNFPDAFIVATNILDLDYQHGGVPHRLSREEALEVVRRLNNG